MRAKHLSLVTLLLTFLLLTLGGIVHNTESSLACPDWPLCYGKVFPKMQGGVLIEHSHRLLASLVGLFTIGLCWLTRREQKSEPTSDDIAASPFRLSLLALFLVIVQGLLGGITVLYELPTIVSTTHLGLSMVYFSILILIHHKLSETKKNHGASLREDFSAHWNPLWRHLLLAGGIFVYLQMLLGAFMRHTGAGASCGLGPKNWLSCLNVETWTRSWWPAEPAAELHMTHRFFAIVVGVALISCLFLVFRFLKRVEFPGKRSVAFFSWGTLLTLFLQIALGIGTVVEKLALIPTTLHLTGAALLLAFVWKLFLLLSTCEEELYAGKPHSPLSDIVALTKPKLSGLVMMTVFVGLILAPQEIYFFRALLALFLIALLVFGSAALNCYMEKVVDGKMERTRDRPLPAGRLRPQTALVFGFVLVGLSLVGLVLFVNVLTAILGALASALYLFAYTPLKQMTPLAVYVGAVPGAIPPLMGWAVVTGEMTLTAWVLFGILFLWQLPHFMAISIYLANDYGAAKIQVYPNLKGMLTTKKNMAFFTVLLALVAVSPGIWGSASPAYLYSAIALSGAILLYALKGFLLERSESVHRQWARKYFLGTIAYLPLLLGAMIFLR